MVDGREAGVVQPHGQGAQDDGVLVGPEQRQQNTAGDEDGKEHQALRDGLWPDERVQEGREEPREPHGGRYRNAR